MDTPSTLTKQKVTFPCTTESGTMILLSGELIQLGKKHVAAPRGEPTNPQEEPAALVAFTLYKEDWSFEDWKIATAQPAMFIRDKLAVDRLDKAILSFWGKSLRRQRSPASPNQATTVQIHGSVEGSRLHALLCASGHNSIYCLPKTSQGRPSEDYRIIWIEGDHAKAMCVSSQTVGCTGIIKGKGARNFGLRYKVDDFPKAWSIINPSETLPTKATGQHACRVEGLPFGVSQQALRTWIQAMKWEAHPLRPLGGHAWVVKSDLHPPEGLQHVQWIAHPDQMPTAPCFNQPAIDPWCTTQASWHRPMDSWTRSLGNIQVTSGSSSGTSRFSTQNPARTSGSTTAVTR